MFFRQLFQRKQISCRVYQIKNLIYEYNSIGIHVKAHLLATEFQKTLIELQCQLALVLN